MKFLCDVHITYKLVHKLKSFGFKAMHVNELPEKWNTTDAEICSFADENEMIVITKDSDFKNNFLLKNSPKKLIKVNLGNVSNQELIHVILKNLEAIREVDSKGKFLLEVEKNSISYFTP